MTTKDQTPDTNFLTPEEYRAFFDLAVEGFFRSTKDGRFLHANPGLLAMTGYEKLDDLKKIAIETDFYVDSLKRLEFKEIMSKAGRVDAFEYQVKRKDAGTIWVSVSARQVCDPQTSEVLYYEGCVQNISERKTNEQRLHELIESAPVGYQEMDSCGNITFVNQTELDMLGYNRDEMLGKPAWLFLIPEQVEESRLSILEKLTNHPGSNSFGKPFERSYRRKNGAKMSTIVHDRPIVDSTGRSVAIRSTISEASAAMQLEQLLSKPGMVSADIIEAPHVFVFCKDIKGRFSFANKHFRDELSTRLSELGCETLEGLDDYSFFPREQADTFNVVDQEILSGRETVVHRFERHSPLGGKDRMVQVIKSPITDHTGKITGLQGIYWDVVDHRAVELELRTALDQELRRFRAAEAQARFGWWEWDAEEDRVEFSPGLLKIFGLHSSISNPTVADIRLFVLEEDQAIWDTNFNILQSKLNFAPTVIRIQRSNKVRYLYCKSELIDRDDSGLKTRIRGIVQDVTELKEVEAQKDLLLRELHHRVSNNLIVASSLISLASRSFQHPKLQQVLKDCRNRISIMANIHESLYKSETHVDVSAQKQINDLVTSLVSAYSSNPGIITATVQVDDIRLSVDQATPLLLITNELVSNSLQYAFPNARHGKLTVGLRKDDGSLLLEVSDNGIGLPEGFDLNIANSLGLRLVNSLADQLHATVSIFRDGGTRFLIDIPISVRHGG